MSHKRTSMEYDPSASLPPALRAAYAKLQNDIRESMAKAYTAKDDIHWDLWKAYCRSIHQEPFLPNVQDPVVVLQVFAIQCREGRASHSGRAVVAGTVSDALRSVGHRFANRGLRDPRKDSFGKMDYRITAMLTTYTREDGPPKRVKPPSNALPPIGGQSIASRMLNGPAPLPSTERQMVRSNIPHSPVTDFVSTFGYLFPEFIVNSSRWPNCVNGTPDWANLFGSHAWLTPRMAAKLHHTAVCHAESALKDFEDGLPVSSPAFRPRLPKVAHPLFQEQVWRQGFQDCYARIAMRLQKGLDPQPNCTGEEMAYYNIVQCAPDADNFIVAELEMLPKRPHDGLLGRALKDDDEVLMLFDDASRTVLLGIGDDATRASKLHPQNWFLPFRTDRFRDHE